VSDLDADSTLDGTVWTYKKFYSTTRLVYVAEGDLPVPFLSAVQVL
jgi:hypothetical protein